MSRVRAGLIGVGHFGRHHLTNLQALTDACELVGFHDQDAARGNAIAAETGAVFFPSLNTLLNSVDAAVIAVSTSAHAAVAGQALQRGLHVFLEKPMAATAAEASALARLAQEKKRKLQVGHIERFNPAFEALARHLGSLRITHITARRYAPWSGRALDVSVVLDMMIHDIDLCLSLTRSRIDELSAHGETVRSSTLDRCSAQLRFTTGILADLHADRVSERRLREFVVQTPVGQIIVDLDKKEVIGSNIDLPLLPADGWNPLSRGRDTHHYQLAPGCTGQNMLRCELSSFLQAILDDRPVRVPAEEGLAALSVAEKIIAACRS
ncbi:MAG: Gfo/Idh/MocA family oxidoreductase [Fibrobacterota bacterium]